MSEDNKDNVEYLFRKPGFYKKGPLQFCLYFGTIDELREMGEKMKAEKEEGRKLKLAPDRPDPEPDDAA